MEDKPPESARATLQSHVSGCGAAVPTSSCRAAVPGTLDLGADLDALHFENLAAVAGEDWLRCSKKLSALASQAFGEFAELSVVRAGAAPGGAAVDGDGGSHRGWLERGDDARAVAELEVLVATLRERFWRQLMVAVPHGPAA